jgi:hypothetical protein
MELAAEIEHRLLHGALVGIGELGHLEADRLQGLGHQVGIVLGVGERRDGGIGRVADDERDAFSRLRLACHQGGDNKREPQSQP